ncbi:MAG: hypothetical protein H7263_01065 [Candidatus Sericytochromatia bacterium]|nr:hypothetical protein [Candidatus Sericytochromatia bacterium]
MKTLFKKTLILLSSTLILNILAIDAKADNNYLTVSFKSDTSEKYVKMLNLLTNTSIKQKIDKETYKINVIDTNASLNFFYTIPEVLIINKDNKLQNKKSGDIVEGQVIVRFKSNVTKEEIQKLDTKLRTNSKLISLALNLYITKLPNEMKVTDAIELFKQTKMIEYAEPDRVMKIQKNGFGIKNIKEQRNISIVFRKQNENIAQSLFSIIYDNRLIKLNKTYLLSIDDNIDANYLIKALKFSPYIAEAKLFLGNK